MQKELITKLEAIEEFGLEVDVIRENLIKSLKGNKEVFTKEMVELIEVKLANIFGEAKYLHAKEISELKSAYQAPH